jgi:multicomponent Na+:H+ antiporter subunit D
VVAIGRIAFQVYGPSAAPVRGLLLTAGLVSALLGAVLALAQDDLKRLLAYDTVSQVGIITVGLGTGTAAGVAGGVYHLINHALFKSLLFLCAGAIVHQTGVTKLSEMGGLARRMPLITAAFVLGVLSIAGIPPLNGYVSVSLIHQGLAGHHEIVPYLLVLAAQAVTIAALGRAAWLAFFRPAPGPEQRGHLRPGMIAGLASLGACCVAFGAAGPLVLRKLMAPAAASLLHPAQYASAVLAGAGRLPAAGIPFDYVTATELGSLAATLVLGAVLAWGYLRVREPKVVTGLRALHTGSANDYAAYAIAGTLAVIAVLALA